MCLAIPAQIEKVEGSKGVAAIEGTRLNVVLALVPEAKVGDWVLVHAGYAITVLDEQDARQTYELLKEARQLAAEDKESH